MSGLINQRKREHLAIIAQDSGIERGQNGLDRYHLQHRALPEIALENVDTRVEFLGKTLSFPLIISSMTGGDDALICRINQNLAQAAEACQVAMAVGSQRVMMREAAAKKSFALREFAPSTVLLGNLGAVQLNYGFGIKECLQAIETLAAEGLYLHLNPLQEAIQPEGNTNFHRLSDKIAALVSQLPVPVLLKEVGCGLSLADIALGIKAGIKHFDIAGRGGTSWSRIEYHRRHQPNDTLGLIFQDWGLPMAEALKQAHQSYPEQTFIASGGIRNGIDMAKSIALGAQLCGIAAPFLAAAQDSAAAVIAQIQQLQQQYRTALFLLGCSNSAELRGQHSFFIQDLS